MLTKLLLIAARVEIAPSKGSRRAVATSQGFAIITCSRSNLNTAYCERKRCFTLESLDDICQRPSQDASGKFRRVTLDAKT